MVISNFIIHVISFRYEIKFKTNSGILKKVEHLYKEYCDWYLAPENSEQIRNTRQKWQQLEHENPEGPSVVS